MLDYFYASLLREPETVDLAHFYGASFNLTAKMMPKARKYATVPAHNLELSLDEWGKFGFWQPPPPHLTDDMMFRYLVHGLRNLTVVCPSTNSQNYLKTKLDLDSVLIPHGTDTSVGYGADKPNFNVFHLSSFGPDKGQTYLLKAWKLLQSREPKTITGKLKMCCYGIIETAYQNIQNLEAKQWVSETEKASLYLNASVYVQSSVTEGFGLTVLEAMARGCPVIVTEGVGAKDCVTEGSDGFIVPIRNPDKIAEFIQFFHDNPSEVKRMGQNARRKAEQYSWDFIEARYVKLYEGN